MMLMTAEAEALINIISGMTNSMAGWGGGGEILSHWLVHYNYALKDRGPIMLKVP